MSPRRLACLLGLALLAALLLPTAAFAQTSWRGPQQPWYPSSWGTRQLAVAPSAPAVPQPIPPHDVVLRVGDDFQAVVDANPPGTTYLVAAGLHREQSVVPHDGDTFVGESGAVMSGARDLSGGVAAWAAAAGFWFVGDQTQEGFVHGTLIEGGNPRDTRPEELFVNGARWTHVGSVGELGAGRWFFDYAADRIWIGADPAGLGLIETSTTVGAFGGTGVRGVTIQNLVVERYATPAQHGAIGFFGGQFTHDWTIRDTTVRSNHGAGIRLAPGMTVEGCEVYDNGQIGLAGDGTDRSGGDTDGYTAQITIRGSDIHHNLVLDYDWGWEGGAMKLKYVSAALLEGNWVHHNAGPGIWFDIDNRNVTVRGNLVEANYQSGIFYEISYGPTLIEGNTVVGNGADPEAVGDEGAGIDISNSNDVIVAGNSLNGNRNGILVRDDDRDPGLRRVHVRDNHVSVADSGFAAKTRDVAAGEATYAGNVYYHAVGTDPGRRWRVGNDSFDYPSWRSQGYDAGSAVTVGSPSPATSTALATRSGAA